MQKLLVILDFPHHRRHSLRFPVPLLLPVRKQILLRRPCPSLESRSTWEWKLETIWRLQQCPVLKFFQLYSPPMEPRWLAAHPPQSWGQGPPSSEPYSRSTCSLSGVLANVSCLHWFSRASLYFIVFCS